MISVTSEVIFELDGGGFDRDGVVLHGTSFCVRLFLRGGEGTGALGTGLTHVAFFDRVETFLDLVEGILTNQKPLIVLMCSRYSDRDQVPLLTA